DSLAMPPPRPSDTRPLAMVRPARITVAPPWMSKTRLVLWPLTVSGPAPSHSMSRLLSMTSSPPVSVMVWSESLPAKWMVSSPWLPARRPTAGALRDRWGQDRAGRLLSGFAGAQVPGLAEGVAAPVGVGAVDVVLDVCAVGIDPVRVEGAGADRQRAGVRDA